MADPRFFTRKGPFTLAALAALTGAELLSPDQADRRVSDVSPLQGAGPDDLSFLDNKKYTDVFRSTAAGACFVRPELAAEAPGGTVCLASRNPYKAYALAAQAFYPSLAVEPFLAPGAFVDETAKVEEGCSIGHSAVIGARAEIGAGTRIGPGAVVGEGVVIGRDCDIGANAVLSHTVMGARVKVYPGAVIGRPGFGFAMDESGFVSVPQLGRVMIGDDVEIGANTTIDRGAGPDTVIGQGTRIDNLVQIGHNVQIGKYCVIVAQTGISGSTRLGDFVMTGGQSGFAGHISVGDGARIAAQSGVMRDIAPGSEMMGTPAVSMKTFMRQVALLNRMSARKGGEDK